MDTIIKAPRHFRLYGAALAMAALLAVLLAVTMTAGPTMAQEPRTGDNAVEYDAPVPCSEEAVPDSDTVRVITEGFYPVFEGFWDYEVGHLSNNFCPPKVTVTTPAGNEGEEGGNEGEEGETTYTRSDANIHISKTAFSVPTSYKVKVVESAPSATEPEIALADYPFLRGAVSAGDSIWWVRLDEPDTTGADEDETSPLKIGLSTVLMEGADWFRDDDDDRVSDGPPVEFHFSAVHVLVAGAPVETHVVGANFFAFDQRETDTPLRKPLWSDAKTDDFSEIGMETGQYKPLQFAFTKPGVYRVQVNVQGHVRKTNPYDEGTDKDNYDDWSRISPDDTITGPVEWFTFHVGPEADLGVALEHTDETTGDDTTTVTDGEASFSVTATNNGPETAEGVVVEVSLPVGLDYVTDDSHTDLTYECGVISWRVGNLASGASEALDFTASVSTGAAKTLTADAEVHSSTVDDNELNDTASVEVKTDSTVVTPPYFPGVTRSIVEHAVAGTHVGDPVTAINPDGRALTYTLTGSCHNWFEVDSNGQIKLAAGRALYYDEQSEFHLTLNVSDGVDASGNDDTATDTAIDSSIPVTIQVQAAAEPFTVDLSVKAEGTLRVFTATLNNLPAHASNVTYTLKEHNRVGNPPITIGPQRDRTFEVSHQIRIAHPIISDFFVEVHYNDPAGDTHSKKSHSVEVEWP